MFRRCKLVASMFIFFVISLAPVQLSAQQVFSFPHRISGGWDVWGNGDTCFAQPVGPFSFQIAYAFYGNKSISIEFKGSDLYPPAGSSRLPATVSFGNGDTIIGQASGPIETDRIIVKLDAGYGDAIIRALRNSRSISLSVDDNPKKTWSFSGHVTAASNLKACRTAYGSWKWRRDQGIR